MAAHAQPQPLGNGRYEIRNPQPLGGGQFGDVFDGWDTYFDRRVAVKLFKPGVAPDQAIIEASTQARLSEHPHVVAIQDVVVEPPRPFMVLEFVTGGSVADQFELGNVSMVDAVRWTRDGLAGLGHAHGLAIVHRDFKPGNLLILENGSAAISDFGLAEDSARDLVASELVYWPHAAPEIDVAGSSPSTDIWAAGCTLYRLLTGQYPFNDPADRLSGLFPRPRDLEPQIPRNLEIVIGKALAVDPADRFASASDMRSALLACGIRCSSKRVADADSIETWEADTPSGPVRMRLVDRPRSGPLLTASRDKGTGFRQFLKEEPKSVALGLQRLRTWLRRLAQGQPLA